MIKVTSTCTYFMSNFTVIVIIYNNNFENLGMTKQSLWVHERVITEYTFLSIPVSGTTRLKVSASEVTRAINEKMFSARQIVKRLEAFQRGLMC